MATVSEAWRTTKVPLSGAADWASPGQARAAEARTAIKIEVGRFMRAG
jgi:hypothetical protein